MSNDNVFPAGAGMNRRDRGFPDARRSVPRRRGDEPEPYEILI